jgi:hypothetical protein
MSRTLGFSLNAHRASVSLPDEYFTETGAPKWHLLNSHFGSPVITWNSVIGGVPIDEDVVYQPTKELPTISEELQKLRAVVAALEKKFDGVKS